MSWQIYVDGASSGNPGDSGAGIVISDGDGKELFRDSVFLGKMTNNMAEYEALLRALLKANEYGAKDVVVYTDSLLVANQVMGAYKINNDILRQYVVQVKKIISNFDHFAIQYIPREQNRIADKLAKNGIKKG
jgi:ribonuclease HI